MFDTRGYGAGIGGLCLAQGLRQAGVLVEVYERDDSPGSRWEGYRIHIDPAVPARCVRACPARRGRRS
jgi:cation diffusion facilitator CzcD-associated flavoprotein CzcO